MLEQTLGRPLMPFPYKKALVTGAGGYIGSNLCDRLLRDGVQVNGLDNFSTGQERFLQGALQSPGFKLLRGDLQDPSILAESVAGCDFVFHLAANADVRFGFEHPDRDLQQNTVGTFRVLEAARAAGVKGFAFSSTGSVYGEPQVHPTPEDAPFPVQTSLYGASKLAGEGLIQAYAEGYGMKAFIFRFVSILGPRYTHGHVFDFYKKLMAEPGRLRVLGNGMQRKSYLHVEDCIEAVLMAVEKSSEKINIYNLGTDEFCEVNHSIGWICQNLGLSPVLEYSGGERGWIGDSPFIFLDARKICGLGWKPKFSIREGVIDTVEWMKANPWVFDAR
jgi:UDP-glucose 4-epimerase